MDLKLNFGIKKETKNVLHLNIISHIKIRYKYPTYSMSQVILKQQAGHIFHTHILYIMYMYTYIDVYIKCIYNMYYTIPKLYMKIQG